MSRALFFSKHVRTCVVLGAMAFVAAMVTAANAADSAADKITPKDRAAEVANEQKATESNTASAESKAAKAIAVPTHHQTAKLQIDTSDSPQAKVSCFCLTKSGSILAGCVSDKGEIQVLNADGKLAKTWPLPVKPEAIFSRDDGAIFVAGDGQLLKLKSSGEVELSKAAPHAAALNEHPEKLREEVVAQAKARAEQFGRQVEVYDKMIAQADKQLETIKGQIAALDKSSEAAKAESKEQAKEAAAEQPQTPKRVTQSKPILERRLAMYTRQKEQFEQMKKQFGEMLESNTKGELTDQQIDEQVKDTLAYKMKASSISAIDGEVYLATHGMQGYGFDVWRMNDRFEDASTIVTDLRGCCGQMDVKAGKDGLFVAENAEHRVCHFDREGKSVAKWGESARTGIEGFGSCCNPMNVAIGPGNIVYTAEDNNGRIKRYSAEGKLLGLVGSVELKPGCKNCSIAVSDDGSRIYMLDITRNFIARLDARPPAEIAADIEKMKTMPAEAQQPNNDDSDESDATTTSAGGGFLDSLRRLISAQ